jgi:hypothetical protein
MWNEMSGSECEERKDSGKMGSVKKVVEIRSSSLQLTTTLAQQSPLSASVN